MCKLQSASHSPFRLPVIHEKWTIVLFSNPFSLLSCEITDGRTRINLKIFKRKCCVIMIHPDDDI